mgnify:CR=1 FL=1
MCMKQGFSGSMIFARVMSLEILCFVGNLCLEYNSNTTDASFMKFHMHIDLNERNCHAQEP